MFQKLVLIKPLILIVFVTLTFKTTVAQNQKKNRVPLTTLLDKISNKHKIFFTYSANLLSNKIIQEDGFINLSLKETISLLEKLTSFSFDDLGNNYYVIYGKKHLSKKIILNKEKTFINSSITVDKILSSSKINVRGIVLSSDNKPLSKATLQEAKFLFGTTTNLDGTFNFEIEKDNNITISFLGHKSKTLKLLPNTFNTIVLVSGQELDEVQVLGSETRIE